MVAGSWGFYEVQEAGFADLVQDACGGRTFKTMLNSSDESGHPCLVPVAEFLSLFAFH